MALAGLNHSVGHWVRHHAEGVHDSVRILFTDLAEQGAHSGASTPTQ